MMSSSWRRQVLFTVTSWLPVSRTVGPFTRRHWWMDGTLTLNVLISMSSSWHLHCKKVICIYRGTDPEISGTVWSSTQMLVNLTERYSVNFEPSSCDCFVLIVFVKLWVLFQISFRWSIDNHTILLHCILTIGWTNFSHVLAAVFCALFTRSLWTTSAKDHRLFYLNYPQIDGVRKSDHIECSCCQTLQFLLHSKDYFSSSAPKLYSLSF